MNLRIRNPIKFLFLSLLPLGLLQCSTTNYQQAIDLYLNSNYEAALRTIDKAIQQHPDEQKYALLRGDILVKMYRSNGLPVIAHYYLLQNQLRNTSHTDEEDLTDALLNEIKKKFSIRIVLRLPDAFSELDKQAIRSNLNNFLRVLSEDNLFSFTLLAEPDPPFSLVLDILFDGFSFSVTAGEPEYLSSSYYSGTTRQPNPAYLALIVENRKIKRWHDHLIALYTSPDSHPHWDAEYLVMRTKLDKIAALREKTLKRLKATPPHILTPTSVGYRFMKRQYILDLAMNCKYMTVDLDHRLVWNEDTLKSNAAEEYEEITNVNPNDTCKRVNRELTYEDLDEAISRIKQHMYSQLTERLKGEVESLLYRRATDYQKHALTAEAWEHYSMFLRIKSGEDEECAHARLFVSQDPLKLHFQRDKTFILERGISSVQAHGFNHKQSQAPPRSILWAENSVQATSVSSEELTKSVHHALEEFRQEVRLEEQQFAASQGAEQERFKTEPIYFEPYKACLLPEAKDILRQKVEYLRAHPAVSVIIEGHCDERGTTAANLVLGEKRAESVKHFLVELGIEPERLKTISYGRQRPVKPGHSEESWAVNRRVELTVNKDTQPLR